MTAPITAPATATAPSPFLPDAPRTKAGTPLVKLALSRAKKAGLFDDVAKTTGRKVAIGLRANGSHTGSWTFERKRGGRHVITLDPNAHLGISMPKPRHATDEWVLSCFASILRHEAHHALHTERDLFRINKLCASHGVPFVSLNIGEDIRIDEIARRKHGFYGWAKWYGETKAIEATEPLAWLVWAKIYETYMAPVTWKGVAEAERIRLGKADGKGKRAAVVILREFYNEFAATASTSDVVTLLRDLFLTFPTAEQDITKIGGLPSGIVGHGYGGTADATEIVHADTPVAIAPVTTDTSERGTADSRRVQPERFMAAGGTFTIGWTAEMFERVTGRVPSAIAAQARRVADRMARLMGSVGGQPDRIATSGRRIHIGNAIAGRAEAFRVAGERKGTCPRVVAVFDQSGSMASDFATHGAAFLGAMLLLSRQGLIDGHIVLTGGGKHAILPPTFPVEKVVHFACGEGCETVRDTLDAQRKLVQSADIVLIYTDAELTDGVVDAGKWRSHGVDLIGCAVTDGLAGYDGTMKRRKMTTHFHRALLAETGEQLATKIAEYIATRSK